MGDLDLPTLGDPGGPRDAAVSPVVGASGQSTGAPAAKFQLGETQPFVPVRIVKRILQGHFVEMAELSEENLGLELRRGSEEEEGKAVPGRRLKEVPSFTAWTRAFCIYTGVVISAHPSKARDLLAYIALLSAGGRGVGLVAKLRQALQAAAPRPGECQLWEGRPDQSAGAQAVAQRAAGADGRAGPVPKRRRAAACYAWNDGRACVASPCRFAHICARCGGDHRKPAWRAVALPVAQSELVDGPTRLFRFFFFFFSFSFFFFFSWRWLLGVETIYQWDCYVKMCNFEYHVFLFQKKKKSNNNKVIK